MEPMVALLLYLLYVGEIEDDGDDDDDLSEEEIPSLSSMKKNDDEEDSMIDIQILFQVIPRIEDDHKFPILLHCDSTNSIMSDISSGYHTYHLLLHPLYINHYNCGIDFKEQFYFMIC